MLHTVPRFAGKCVRLRECGGVGARGIVRAKDREALHKLVRVRACVSARVSACARARVPGVRIRATTGATLKRQRRKERQ